MSSSTAKSELTGSEKIVFTRTTFKIGDRSDVFLPKSFGGVVLHNKSIWLEPKSNLGSTMVVSILQQLVNEVRRIRVQRNLSAT
jgi:hypothetical protein